MYKIYMNLTSKSGVRCYRIEKEYIDIQFKNTPFYIYRYSNVKPGKGITDELKRLAENGIGLNSYINKYVKDNFEFKYIATEINC